VIGDRQTGLVENFSQQPIFPIGLQAVKAMQTKTQPSLRPTPGIAASAPHNQQLIKVGLKTVRKNRLNFVALK
jgi:hypothetical protein